jgi:hypothetical protein
MLLSRVSDKRKGSDVESELFKLTEPGRYFTFPRVWG